MTLRTGCTSRPNANCASTTEAAPAGYRRRSRRGRLWEYYCQYAYLPRLAERSVLDRGIIAVFDQIVWDQDGFAVASGYDEASGRYIGLAIPQENIPPQITDSTLLVRPDRAVAQREQERAEQEAAPAPRPPRRRAPQAPGPSPHRRGRQCGRIRRGLPPRRRIRPLDRSRALAGLLPSADPRVRWCWHYSRHTYAHPFLRHVRLEPELRT